MKKSSLALIPAVAFVLLGSVSLYAQIHISGPQSGILGPGTYIVDGNITVLQDSSLRIRPGTGFLHAGAYVWEIWGRLNADGALGDSIVFTRENPTYRWRGMRFMMNSSDSSSLDYCIIERCYHNYMSFMGGGIYAEGITLPITNSRISNCEGFPDGGGIYSFGANLTIDHCLIVDNHAIEEGNGGGVCFFFCPSSRITNSIVARNSSTST